MSKKLLYYILVLIGAWFMWDYTRHRHTEMWWLKRFMSYPGVRAGDLIIDRSVEMAYLHLQRLKKYHPDKIRKLLPYEKELSVPVNSDWFKYVPESFWMADINDNPSTLNAFQKRYVKRQKALRALSNKESEIRKKYEENA